MPSYLLPHRKLKLIILEICNIWKYSLWTETCRKKNEYPLILWLAAIYTPGPAFKLLTLWRAALGHPRFWLTFRCNHSQNIGNLTMYVTYVSNESVEYLYEYIHYLNVWRNFGTTDIVQMFSLGVTIVIWYNNMPVWSSWLFD